MNPELLVLHDIAVLADPLVGSRIRAYRKRRKLTQDKLARNAGLSQAAICRIERNPCDSPLGHFQRICEALGIQITDLIEGDINVIDFEDMESIKPSFAKAVVSTTADE